MPKICYVRKKFRDTDLERITTVNDIVTDYNSQGFQLTLRQVYYQFVSRGLLENTERSYKNLGTLISDGRLAGLIDWYAIEDRTRYLRGLSHWDDPAEIIRGAASGYRIDKWQDQPYHVEVWVEKDALVGVLQTICNELDVSYFSCRGYTSQSEMWSAAQRLKSYARSDQTPYIIHLGDHDPSGKDMSRDIEDRLALFMGGTDFKRIALNMDQIDQYSPPPNPAKVTDSRAANYIAEFGDESWELDALEPAVLVALIRETVLDVRDQDKWDAAIAQEEAQKATVQKAADRWVDVCKYLESAG